MADQPIPEAFEYDLVYSLFCDPETGLCFAGRGSGLYRSDDGGATWTFAYESLEITEPLPTISVATAPGAAASDELRVFAGVPGGVVRSLDGGATWIAEPLGSPPPAVSDLVISPDFDEDGVILAGTTEDGVYRSANRGSNWTRWNFGLLDLNVMCLAISPAFAEDETLFAGVESGIFRSTNGARAWREVDLPVGFEPVLSLAISPDYADDGTLFAGTESQGLLCSYDGGKTWTRMETGELVGPVNQLMLAREEDHSFTLLVLLEDALQISRDSGATWLAVQADVGRITAVAAPEGLGRGARLLVGCLDGEVQRVELTV